MNIEQQQTDTEKTETPEETKEQQIKINRTAYIISQIKNAVTLLIFTSYLNGCSKPKTINTAQEPFVIEVNIGSSVRYRGKTRTNDDTNNSFETIHINNDFQEDMNSYTYIDLQNQYKEDDNYYNYYHHYLEETSKEQKSYRNFLKNQSLDEQSSNQKIRFIRYLMQSAYKKYDKDRRDSYSTHNYANYKEFIAEIINDEEIRKKIDEWKTLLSTANNYEEHQNISIEKLEQLFTELSEISGLDTDEIKKIWLSTNKTKGFIQGIIDKKSEKSGLVCRDIALFVAKKANESGLKDVFIFTLDTNSMSHAIMGLRTDKGIMILDGKHKIVIPTQDLKTAISTIERIYETVTLANYYMMASDDGKAGRLIMIQSQAGKILWDTVRASKKSPQENIDFALERGKNPDAIKQNKAKINWDNTGLTGQLSLTNNSGGTEIYGGIQRFHDDRISIDSLNTLGLTKTFGNEKHTSRISTAYANLKLKPFNTESDTSSSHKLLLSIKHQSIFDFQLYNDLKYRTLAMTDITGDFEIEKELLKIFSSTVDYFALGQRLTYTVNPDLDVSISFSNLHALSIPSVKELPTFSNIQIRTEELKLGLDNNYHGSYEELSFTNSSQIYHSWINLDQGNKLGIKSKTIFENIPFEFNFEISKYWSSQPYTPNNWTITAEGIYTLSINSIGELNLLIGTYNTINSGIYAGDFSNISSIQGNANMVFHY